MRSLRPLQATRCTLASPLLVRVRSPQPSRPRWALYDAVWGRNRVGCEERRRIWPAGGRRPQRAVHVRGSEAGRARVGLHTAGSCQHTVRMQAIAMGGGALRHAMAHGA